MRLLKQFGLLLFAASLLWGISFFLTSKNEVSSVKTDNEYRFDYRKEEKQEALKARFLPRDWEAIAHGEKLGFDWRNGQARTLQQFRDHNLPAAASDRDLSIYGPFKGEWLEKGPSKIPGRVTASEVLYAQDRIYLLTDGGYLFRGPLSGNNWECLNDHYPLARGVDARIEVVRLPRGNNRILVGGWDAQNLGNKLLQYSDDEGLTWNTPEGLPNAVWYRRTMADGGGRVYHLIRSDASGSPKMQLYRSTDFGAHFSLHYSHNLSAGDRDRTCDMWKLEKSDTIYAVFENKFLKIASSGQFSQVGQISNLAFPEWTILTGGRENSTQPFTFYVRVVSGGQNTIYKSTNGGLTWSSWGTLADGLLSPFSNYAFVTNPSDPRKVYAGGWIVGGSTDGQNWTYPHDLGGYVGYHGDVPDMNFVRNPNTGQFDFFIGTDGGFFKYDPSTDHFNPLGAENLGNTQIYKMASDHTTEHRMYIGTQDNGFNFNHTLTAPAAIAPFNYLWGGDVTQVTSGDKGKSFWCFWWGSGCNYVKNAANLQSSGIANWQPIYDSEYWELPAKADPATPDECLVAGYITASPTGSYLVRLKSPANLQPGQVLPLQQEYGNYDFKAASGGGRIGAIGISPLNSNHIYVMTDNGVFFWSLNKGQSWQKNTAAKDKIWPRYIAVSPTVAGEVFVGGAGYGNNTPCWRITQHGQTMTAAQEPSFSVLKDNRVNGLCFDPTGRFVFAAADVGAFVYVVKDNLWRVLSGDPSPLTHFHDVEYLENSNTVRFATYARGVWDFKINQVILREGGTVAETTRLNLFPNPASDKISIDLAAFTDANLRISITDISGKVVFEKQAYWSENSLLLDLKDWKPGVYFVSIDTGKAQPLTAKFIHL